MDVIIPVFFIVAFLTIVFLFYRKLLIAKQSKFITTYEFPSTIKEKVLKTYPHLSDSEVSQVILGLREYFHLIHLARDESVAMPSQAVDIAWHEFILFTQEYARFCSKSFGRFIHHTPAEAMKSQTESQVSIKRAWELSCSREQINPFAPNRLPNIFALDFKYQIPDGFYYKLDCSEMITDSNEKSEQKAIYCASHISISADFAPTLDGNPVGGGRGCSGGGNYTGCSSGGSGCSGGGGD